jgi:hypothetical protein
MDWSLGHGTRQGELNARQNALEGWKLIPHSTRSSEEYSWKIHSQSMGG